MKRSCASGWQMPLGATTKPEALLACLGVPSLFLLLDLSVHLKNPPRSRIWARSPFRSFAFFLCFLCFLYFLRCLRCKLPCVFRPHRPGEGRQKRQSALADSQAPLCMHRPPSGLPAHTSRLCRFCHPLSIPRHPALPTAPKPLAAAGFFSTFDRPSTSTAPVTDPGRH